MEEEPTLKEHLNGSKSWYLNGKVHRVDGPAIEHPNGSKEWWLNGIYHRIDKLNEWPLQLYLGYIKWKKNN